MRFHECGVAVSYCTGASRRQPRAMNVEATGKAVAWLGLAWATGTEKIGTCVLVQVSCSGLLGHAVRQIVVVGTSG